MCKHVTNSAAGLEFMKGNFVVQKSARKFSLMAKDQTHEQSNKSLQTHGGAVGLYEKPEALTLFMLAGPDCTRVIEEFEAINDPPLSSTAHHEEGQSLQLKFRKDVISGLAFSFVYIALSGRFTLLDISHR